MTYKISGAEHRKEINPVKKTGWILYYEKDLKKNQRFVDIVADTMEKENIEIKVILLNSIHLSELLLTETPDFVINRSRNHKVARMLEAAGIRVFNNGKVTETANDKEKTYDFFRGDIPFMPILKAGEKEYPFVMKSCYGHGGNQVYLVTNKQEEEFAKKKMANQKYICQKYCNQPGKDLRVYVINKEIVVSMLREAASGFRSNYSLGGKATVYQLSEKEKSVVYQVLEKIDIDYGGIDFIFHDNRMMLNEIEDAVGARMVYENTEINILERFARYVIGEIK